MNKKLYLLVVTLFVSSAIIFSALFFLTLQNNKVPKDATVISQLRELSRYETASFTVEKIVEVGESRNSLRDLFFGEKLLLVAHGIVIAGFNLEMLSENAVKVSGTEIAITLPVPELLHVTLDNEKTRVYDRETGIFTTPDQGLEREARLLAEDAMYQAACEADLLESASENARTQLSLILSAMGFTKVSIEIPTGSCTR